MNKPANYNPTEIDFLKSLNDSDLIAVLGELPRQEQAAVLQSLMDQSSDVHDKDVDRKRSQRSRAAEVTIGAVANPARRAACLADPVMFLKTYGFEDDGSETFYNEFAEHHLAMIQAIDERSVNGGDKAVAAPRGDGKSTVAIWMSIYIILTGRLRSLVIIAATRKHAQKLFRRIKKAFSRNDILKADFPEICDCVRELDGAPQRAAKQHVNGERTGIVWTQDEIVFPFVKGSPYGGIHVAYYGLDSAIRGGRFEFALIDDPETREAAYSEDQNAKIEDMIDGDVAGLAGPNSAISRVILTTIQNRRSYSFRVTDPKIKPTFAGDRFGMLSAWPTDRDAWDQYIAMRQQGQNDGDKDGLKALAFYEANREGMEAGAVVTNPHRFNRRLNADGVAVEVSAIQSFFNRVADWGLSRVMAELQNDPDEEESEQTLQLTAGKVASRISGLSQNELPRVDECKITVGLDVGNLWSNWVKVAWFGNATGVILDYGILENQGAKTNMDQSALTASLIPSLMQWRTDILSENPPDFCLIDSGSGTHVEAVYEFVRQAGGTPFAPSKGWASGRFHIGKDTPTRRCFYECAAEHQKPNRLWLYHVNTEFWKQWLQERFVAPTFDESQQFNDGSLSLFAAPNDPKRHLSFSHHITAEEKQELFVPGKGMQTKWVCKNKNNHYLDALALACAAAGVIGIRLIKRESLTERPAIPAKPLTQQQQAQQNQSPQNKFRTRQGGWVKGLGKNGRR